MTDAMTVAVKELKELFTFGEGKRGWLLQVVVFVGWLGIFMPIEQPHFAKGPALAGFLPLILTGSVVADSFAGERDRKTLETLLATRLPDHSIFLGKVAAGVGYAWLMTMIVSLVSIVAVNLAGHPYVPTPSSLAIRMALALLVSTFVAGTGVFISLRSRTAREAQQTLSLVFMLAPISLIFIIPALAGVLPLESAGDSLVTLISLNPAAAAAAAMVALAVLDAILLTAGMRRFRRSRLLI